MRYIAPASNPAIADQSHQTKIMYMLRTIRHVPDECYTKSRASEATISGQIEESICELFSRQGFNMNYLKIEALCVGLPPREICDTELGIVE